MKAEDKSSYLIVAVVALIVVAILVYIASKAKGAGPGDEIPYSDPRPGGGNDDPGRYGGFGWIVFKVVQADDNGPPIAGATAIIWIDGLQYVQGITGADGKTQPLRVPSGKGMGFYVSTGPNPWDWSGSGGMAGGVSIGWTEEILVPCGRLR